MFSFDQGSAFRRDADAAFFEDESVSRVPSEEETRTLRDAGRALRASTEDDAAKSQSKKAKTKPKRMTKAQARRFVDKMTASGW